MVHSYRDSTTYFPIMQFWCGTDGALLPRQHHILLVLCNSLLFSLIVNAPHATHCCSQFKIIEILASVQPWPIRTAVRYWVEEGAQSAQVRSTVRCWDEEGDSRTHARGSEPHAWTRSRVPNTRYTRLTHTTCSSEHGSQIWACISLGCGYRVQHRFTSDRGRQRY
jgi:hypothetical protein